MTKLAEMATKYAEICEWLDACPFRDGQAFYETATTAPDGLEELSDTMATLLPAAELEAFHAAVEDGDYGEFETEAEWFRALAKRI